MYMTELVGQLSPDQFKLLKFLTHIYTSHGFIWATRDGWVPLAEIVGTLFKDSATGVTRDIVLFVEGFGGRNDLDRFGLFGSITPYVPCVV